MKKLDYDMIVIGGGAAGLTASTFAAQSSAKTLLIEKEEKLGGDCLHYGCVPSKSLIKSGYVYHVLRNAERYGLPPVDVPPVDYQKIRERIRTIIDTIQQHDEPGYLKDHYHVETRFGCPRFLDGRTIELNGRTLTSRFFIIATGSSPFLPAVPGLQDVPYLTNRGIFSLEKFPASLIVLGGGPIGLEMAQAMARLGSKVTVVQSAGQLLTKEDGDVAGLVKERLASEGLEILLNAKACRAGQDQGRIWIDVEGEGSRRLEADALLVATGRRPNIEGLGLEQAGVEYDERAVRVDSRLRTTARSIYACGDVNGGLQFTHVAGYEAVVAVCNAVLKTPRKTDYSHVPWCTYLDPEVASIGYNELRARAAGLRFSVQKEFFKNNDRALAEGETEGFIKILIGRRGRAIGVQMVGFHAGDLISEWVPVLNGRVPLATVSDAIHAYPTMAEINKNASVRYLVSTIPPWTKKLLRQIFGYQGEI